ncbi:unnamed protein product, partial [Mesorhabditis spiculigera]
MHDFKENAMDKNRGETDNPATINCQVISGKPLDFQEELSSQLLADLFKSAASNRMLSAPKQRGRPPGVKNSTVRSRGPEDREYASYGGSEGPVDVTLMKKLGFMGKNCSSGASDSESQPSSSLVMDTTLPSAPPRIPENHTPRPYHTRPRPPPQAPPSFIKMEPEPIRVVERKRKSELMPETVHVQQHRLEPENKMAMPMMPEMPQKIFDAEALDLYKRALRMQIDRDEAMRDYYRLKKLRLDCQY